MTATRIRTSLRRAGTGLSLLAVSVFPLPPVLPPGGSYASLGEAMRIQGQPIAAWVFDAPGTVPEIASWLTRHQPALRDMWIMPGVAVLAGMAGGMQWAARLIEADGRTQGTLSALSVVNSVEPDGADTGDSSLGSDTRASAASAGPRWKLRGGQLRFELRTREEDVTVIEQVWTHDAVFAVLRKQLADDLTADGWWPADNGDPQAMRTGNYWSRGRARLSTVIVPLGRGSGVTTVLRIEK